MENRIRMWIYSSTNTKANGNRKWERDWELDWEWGRGWVWKCMEFSMTLRYVLDVRVSFFLFQHIYFIRTYLVWHAMSQTPSFTYCSACSLLLNASGGGFRKIFFSCGIWKESYKKKMKLLLHNAVVILMFMCSVYTHTYTQRPACIYASDWQRHQASDFWHMIEFSCGVKMLIVVIS